ncbi:amylo-alpha-1,6-glucosidase [Planosporangium mesophilum]|uniref:Amylo-alpha-1,6-glucosidase n=1 Tax=Planosporangium mesophilum TaxID=689768 RepID=A0A8J3TDB1_9ACTN|nr:glycogen debranching N-terminal domain-containing protein [Planosporangium mesophilum]NJC84225.1 amylo-alpha-1,6-glucosidase [Planosporangium mesophilum]GII23067.1 amylo-alpha-1,6-glucosidase [Planosporangium mesophilum]
MTEAATTVPATTAAAPPQVLNAGEPVLTGGPVTLVEGSTFCLSERSGDVRPGGAHGLFVRDARVLSRWELRLDGYAPQPLAVIPSDAFTARFVLRRPDSSLLLVRERLVGDGLRETLTVENLGREATTAVVTLLVDGDFSDLFAVKEGRTAGDDSQVRGAHVRVAGQELLLTARADAGRGLRVTGSGDPVVTPRALSWRVVVPARGRWSAEVVAEPMVAGRWIEPGFRRGEPVEATAAAQKLRAWRRTSAQVSVDDPVLAKVLRRTETDLGALQITDPDTGRPFVAAGAPWFMTLFGRDSLLTAWMALPLDVNLAIGTLQALAATQARTVDPATDSEPGRILHELRAGPDSDRVLGGSHYYGSVDATPLFVMLLGECWRWGVDEATVRALLPAADAALDWIDRYGDRDGDGFVEYRRATDRGLANQGWKDSSDAMNFADGTLAEAPLALCEVQGYGYAALLARAELAEAFGDSDRAERCRWRAKELRDAFAERYWLPDRGWYAVALDRHKRPVDALTSNAAHCLWTGIARDEHAEVLVRRLSGVDMDTGYGLRTLSAAMGAYNPMSYHNGSVWPHDTAIAVAGLMRYAHVPGAVELAHRLADGVLDAAGGFGGRLPELFCGFGRDQFAPPVPYPTSCSPQAWATAAPLLLVRAVLGLDPHVPHRTLGLAPRLPERWGRVTLSNLRLGPATVNLTAHGDRATVRGLPGDWTGND